MRFNVTKLRDRGRRLTDQQVANAPLLSGNLISSSIASAKGCYKVAELLEDTNGALKESLAVLFEPELVQINSSGLLLRGIEKMEGRAYLQEWRCEMC